MLLKVMNRTFLSIRIRRYHELITPV